MRDELIALLREKLPVGVGDIAPAVVVVEQDPFKFGGRSTDEDTLTGTPEMADTTKGSGPGEVKSPPSKMALPSLFMFSGDKADGRPLTIGCGDCGVTLSWSGGLTDRSCSSLSCT